MSGVLEGTFSDVGLCDLLRLIAREKRSGTLRVSIDGRRLRFALREGRLFGVRSEDGPSEPDVERAVRALVRYRRGAFRLEPPRPEERRGEGDASGLGVEAETLAGAGQLELQRLADRLAMAGGETSHPERGAFPTPLQMEALDRDTRAVYALVNGERTLGELIVRSRLDPDRVLDALARLARASLVTLEPPDAGTHRRGGFTVADAWRDALAAALPLLLIAAWLSLSGPGVRVADTDPFRIRQNPLAAARAEHELERLRAAVEAHRFAEGRWPERLEALVERGYVPPTALTDERGRPYYYAVRDEEFVLLAPER